MNYDSVHVTNAKAEEYLLACKDDTSFQLLRKGYFKTISKNGKRILSEIVTMKDSFKVKSV